MATPNTEATIDWVDESEASEISNFSIRELRRRADDGELRYRGGRYIPISGRRTEMWYDRAQIQALKSKRDRR